MCDASHCLWWNWPSSRKLTSMAWAIFGIGISFLTCAAHLCYSGSRKWSNISITRGRLWPDQQPDRCSFDFLFYFFSISDSLVLIAAVEGSYLEKSGIIYVWWDERRRIEKDYMKVERNVKLFLLGERWSDVGVDFSRLGDNGGQRKDRHRFLVSFPFLAREKRQHKRPRSALATRSWLMFLFTSNRSTNDVSIGCCSSFQLPNLSSSRLNFYI